MWKLNAEVIPIFSGETESLPRPPQEHLKDISCKNARMGNPIGGHYGTAPILRSILTQYTLA
jgi:hypothetical protein